MCFKDHHYSSYDTDYDRKKDDERKSCKDKKSHKHFENCVEDVLEAILWAQKKAEKFNDCKTSCKQSIDELLGEQKKVKKNTIPFILYCGCEPFKGTGVTTYSSHSHKSKFKCIQTHIFKIKELDKKCAVLELLVFKSDLRNPLENGKKCNGPQRFSPCGQIDHQCVDDLVGTGICITVDLSCFCAVTCLPAVHL